MDLSQKIYSILTKRKYNRGKPHLGDEVLRLISIAVQSNEPLKLVGFWGVGAKKQPNWADTMSCQFLNELNTEIKQQYSLGIEFTFIFATLHGIHNGYSKADIDSYVSGMIQIFDEYGYKYLSLDPLWEKYDISFERISTELDKKPKAWWDVIAEAKDIERNAANRNKKYPAKLAAQKYYIMRCLEKEMFRGQFEGYIFHAFSDPNLKTVLPDMPTLYFYGRESWSNAPWFVTSEKGEPR